MTFLPPTHDSRTAKLERALKPGTAWCARCGRPWRMDGHIGVVEHNTRIDESLSCFPLCEGCWLACDVAERVAYYRSLVFDVWMLTSQDHDQVLRQWPDVLWAVLEGR